MNKDFNNLKTDLVRGLDIDHAMEWLNVSRSYIYRLIRSGELEVVCDLPLLISFQSVIDKIGAAFPKAVSVSKSSLDYHLKQDCKNGVGLTGSVPMSSPNAAALSQQFSKEPVL